MTAGSENDCAKLHAVIEAVDDLDGRGHFNMAEGYTFIESSDFSNP
jgi:hypothetical protein